MTIMTPHRKNGHTLCGQNAALFLLEMLERQVTKRVVPSDLQKVTTPISSSDDSAWISNEP